MTLTIKQSKLFIDRYVKRYDLEVEGAPIVIEKTSEELLGISSKEDKAAREARLKKIVPNRDSVYKHRSYGPQTIGNKVLESLWLEYGPREF